MKLGLWGRIQQPVDSTKSKVTDPVTSGAGHRPVASFLWSTSWIYFVICKLVKAGRRSCFGVFLAHIDGVMRQVCAVLNDRTQPYQFQVRYTHESKSVWETLPNLIKETDTDTFLPLLEEYYRKKKVSSKLSESKKTKLNPAVVAAPPPKRQKIPAKKEEKSPAQNKPIKSKEENKSKVSKDEISSQPQKLVKSKQPETGKTAGESDEKSKKSIKDDSPAKVKSDSLAKSKKGSKADKDDKERVKIKVCCEEKNVSRIYVMKKTRKMQKMMADFEGKALVEAKVVIDPEHEIKYYFGEKLLTINDTPVELGVPTLEEISLNDREIPTVDVRLQRVEMVHVD
eukprot:g57479.t1